MQATDGPNFKPQLSWNKLEGANYFDATTVTWLFQKELIDLSKHNIHLSLFT